MTYFARVTATLVLSLPLFGTEELSVGDKFYNAIRQDDATGVDRLLKSGINVNVKDSRGATPLMYAAAVGSKAMMRRLIDAGADVNSKTTFDATALMWCSNSIDRVRMLMEKNADVNARSKQGHTPLFLAASHAGNIDVVKLLLAKGARLDQSANKMGSTALLGASATNDTDTMKLLMKEGDKPDAVDLGGNTPLMLAAGFGNSAMVELLLAKGAKVNAQSAPALGPGVKNGPIAIGNLSPLLLAASGRDVRTVRLLLKAGADVNARDVRGMTPVMLAVATDHPNDEIIKLLLAQKPDLSVKSKAGETVLDWVRKFRNPTVLAVFPAAASEVSPSSSNRPDMGDVRKAAEKGVSLLQTSSASAFREGGCISCHAGNITTATLAVARAKGLSLDQPRAAELARDTRLAFLAASNGLFERSDPPAAEILTYALFALITEGVPPDRTIDAMIQNLAAQQLADGSWGAPGIVRPPTADGIFTHTAFAIRVLQHYAPPARNEEMKGRIARAARLLASTTPATTEDAVMQMLGLKWAGVEAGRIDKLAKGVLALQQTNGGWAQTRHLAPDAYATGTALYALHEAGLPVDSTAYRNGVRFLAATQGPDGSWHVASRAPKFQPYFESGFPYGQDQWISQWATGWATIALAQSLPENRASR